MTDRRLLKLLICLVLLLSSTSLLHAQAVTETLLHNDLERTYNLHLPPAYDVAVPLPLVLALHPTASSGEAMAALTGLNKAADAQNFIVVYPSSSGFAWADGRTAGAGVTDVDDVSYIGALIDHLAEHYAVDTARVYLTGYGGGGALAYRLACTTPERFAGVAVVSTLLWDYHLDACPQESTPLSILIMRGSADPVYLTGGNTFRFSATLSLEDTLEFWGSRNGCDMTAGRELANTILYTDCSDGSRLAYYEVKEGSGSWPRVGDYRLNQSGVDATEVITGFFAGDRDWAMTQTEASAGPPRTYNVYVPPGYNPAVPLPMVVALHGRPDNGAGIAYITDLNTTAAHENFIVAYPDGLNNEWNYTRAVPFFGRTNATDDAQFLSDMIADLAQDLSIDPQRIYVTGFSNGGFMTQRLACEAREQYAAFAVVGATAFLGMTPLCADQTPAPILFIHGTADVSVPWDGIPRQIAGETLYVTAPILRTVEFWLGHNGCVGDYTETELPQEGSSPGTSVHVFEFQGCPAEADVLFYAVLGGGHNWPGVPDRLPEEIAGQVNMDIHASEVIWAFFSQFTQEVAQ